MKFAIKEIAECSAYALLIAAATLVGILVFTPDPSQVLIFFIYALLAEGGLALATGGTVATFSPTLGKVRETIFHHEPWNAKRQKEAEGTARSWIITGIILFALGLLSSAFGYF